jgi:amino acid adenylation domain-containing protein
MEHKGPSVTADYLGTVRLRWSPEILEFHRGLGQAPDHGFPLDRTAADLVRAQASRTSSATAIGDGLSSLNYRELDDLADRVAGGLIAAGCRAGDIVALAASRGCLFVAAVLGILRAGAVYLPVDPRLPAARAQQVLGSSRARAVIADAAARALIEAADKDSTVLALTDLMHADPVREPVPRAAQDAAYAVFTSGSTGRPKGAVVHHAGMVNQLAFKAADLELSDADVVAQNSPQSFDISIWQMLAPLCVGARVEVIPDADATDPAGLLRAVAERRVTVLEVVPSLLAMILDGPRDALRLAASVRMVLVTGEELPPQTARDWFAAYPDIPLVNAYGPTECADDVSHYHMTSPPVPGVARLPIGSAITNVRLWVVRKDEQDDRFTLCGPGESGELWVTGTGVGLGYLNDPDRTREAFAEDPFCPGERLYRTGDIATMDGQGMLTFLGRADRQVKIRGHRIELGEIESIVAENPGVQAVAVDVRRRGRGRRAVAREWLTDPVEPTAVGSRALVCYVVTTVRPRELSEWLARRLPEYMIPDQIIRVPSIQLTPNGKTDYQALPDPGMTRPDLPEEYAAPENTTEEVVIKAWSEVLGIAPVGRNDDFFALGGESLLAMIIINTLNQRFNTSLQVRDLLAARRPADLASIIECRAQAAGQSCGERGYGDLAELACDRERYPLSLGQEGIWFQWKLAPGNAYYNYQGSWTLRGPLDQDALAKAWTRLVESHPVLAGNFPDEEGRAHLVYPVHDLGALPCTDLSAAAPEQASERFHAEALTAAQRPYDLAQDPLVRVHLYRFGPDHHELLFSTHEILLDGWAAVVLTKELAMRYSQVLAGIPAAPVRPGLDDFARFLAWEKRAVTPDRLAGQRSHWREVLHGELPVLRLPLDKPRPASPSYRSGSCSAVLSGQLLSGLTDLGRRHGVTLFGTLLAGYATILARYASQDEVIIGVPTANRNDTQLQETVGFLLNMLPVRLRCDLERPFSLFLADLGGQLRAALSNSEYPFSWMVRDCRADRANDSPIFQTMFNMLNYPEPPIRGGGLKIEFNELETGFTKYELSLYAQPGDHDDLYLELAFQTDLFDRASIDRMFRGLLALYEDVVRDERVRLGDVRIMDQAHWQYLLNPGANYEP